MREVLEIFPIILGELFGICSHLFPVTHLFSAIYRGHHNLCFLLGFWGWWTSTAARLPAAAAFSSGGSFKKVPNSDLTRRFCGSEKTWGEEKYGVEKTGSLFF